MENTGPEFCYSTSPSNAKHYNNKIPTFKWTKTDSASYYILKIYNKNNRAVITSQNLTDSAYTISVNLYPSLEYEYTWNVEAYRKNGKL